MNRAVYIGGFANGRSLATSVGEALSVRHDDVDVFTFSDAMKRPEQIRKAARGVHTYTHSAGFLAIQAAHPKEIHAFNPPLPTSRTRLLARTAVKSANMHMPGRGIHSVEDIAAVGRFDRSATAELVAHPVANLRPFANKLISKFNAIDTAAYYRGVLETPVTLITTDHDDYFMYGPYEITDAMMMRVPLVWLPGEHDELPLRPSQTLHNYFETIPASRQ